MLEFFIDPSQGERFMSRVIGCLVLVSVFALTSVAAQTPEGSIRGYARDEQGAILPGVAITAKAANAVSYTAVTDAGGLYRLQNVQPGTYQVTAELQGFSKLVQDNVDVRAGLNVALDLTLKVGQVTEQVQVKAEAPVLEAQTGTFAFNISG